MIRVINPKDTLNTNTSVALGTFDGLHLGHMTIINKLCSEGGFKKCVFTFSNSPAQVVSNNRVKYIMSAKEKEELLEKSGVDYLVNRDFDEEFMSLTAEEFFKKYILEILHAKEIYVGYNYTFGKNKTGNTEVLKSLCSEHSIKLNVIPPVFSGNEPTSSTRIRNEIAMGNLKEATKLLGRPVCVCGVVTEGNRIGRTIGFPTANIPVDTNRALPPDGVYAASTQINGAVYPCIANLGMRPTVSDKGERLFEAHIIEYEADLYGKYMIFEFAEKIRDIKKFDSVNQLKEQLEKDAKCVKGIMHQKMFDNRKNL